MVHGPNHPNSKINISFFTSSNFDLDLLQLFCKHQSDKRMESMTKAGCKHIIEHLNCIPLNGSKHLWLEQLGALHLRPPNPTNDWQKHVQTLSICLSKHVQAVLSLHWRKSRNLSNHSRNQRRDGEAKLWLINQQDWALVLTHLRLDCVLAGSTKWFAIFKRLSHQQLYALAQGSAQCILEETGQKTTCRSCTLGEINYSMIFTKILQPSHKILTAIQRFPISEAWQSHMHTHPSQHWKWGCKARPQ